MVQGNKDSDKNWLKRAARDGLSSRRASPVPLAFERVRMIGKEASGKKFS
jgi:hypothetical protein